MTFCRSVTVHTFGLSDDAYDALFDRVADAAHELDEELFCSAGDCPDCKQYSEESS